MHSAAESIRSEALLWLCSVWRKRAAPSSQNPIGWGPKNLVKVLILHKSVWNGLPLSLYLEGCHQEFTNSLIFDKSEIRITSSFVYASFFETIYNYLKRIQICTIGVFYFWASLNALHVLGLDWSIWFELNLADLQLRRAKVW